MAATTRQAALAAFGSLARSLGPIRAGPLARAAPAVMTALQDSQRAVRSSALVAAGALLHGIGSHAVQLLPQLAPAILQAAATSVASIAAEAATGSAESTAPPKRSSSKGKTGKDKHQRNTGGEGAAALEAATALAAVMALTRALPKFISPYLPAILQLCLDPVVSPCFKSYTLICSFTLSPRMTMPLLCRGHDICIHRHGGSLLWSVGSPGTFPL